MEHGLIAAVSIVPGDQIVLGTYYDGLCEGRRSGIVARPQRIGYSTIQDLFALVSEGAVADDSLYAIDMGTVYSSGPTEIICRLGISILSPLAR